MIEWEKYTPVPQGTLRIIAALALIYLTITAWPHRLTQGTTLAVISTVALIVGWISVISLLRMKTPSVRQGLIQYWRRNIIGYSRVVLPLEEHLWYRRDKEYEYNLQIVIRLGGFFRPRPRAYVRYYGQKEAWQMWLAYDNHWHDYAPSIWLSDGHGARVHMSLKSAITLLAWPSQRSRGESASMIAWWCRLSEELVFRANQYEMLVPQLTALEQREVQLVSEHGRLHHAVCDALEAMRNAVRMIDDSKRFQKSKEAQQARLLLEKAQKDILGKAQDIPDARRP